MPESDDSPRVPFTVAVVLAVAGAGLIGYPVFFLDPLGPWWMYLMLGVGILCLFGTIGLFALIAVAEVAKDHLRRR